MGRFVLANGQQVYGERISRIVSATGAWAAGASLGDINLDRDFLITNIRIQAAMTATLTATAVADAPKRSLQGISIVGDSKTFFGLTSGVAASQAGVLLAFLNQFDNQGASLDANTDVDDTGFVQMYNLHPGHNPKDPFDLSVCIPAKALSNLVARLVCPLAAVPDAAGNFTAGTYTLEIDGVQGVPVSKNMYYPGGYIATYPHTAVLANYGHVENVPTGGYVRRLFVVTHDNTATAAVRSDAQVTGFNAKISKDSIEFIAHGINGIKYMNAQRYGVVGDAQPIALGALATTRPGYNGAMHMPVGVACLDFRDYFDPVLGLNMVNANEGDVKVGMTIGVATGQDLLYWDIVYPMEPSWLGK
ncbi:MAG: hypothetical protein JW967_01535 [Dehalococcoidales bacterium]|nr:hypothetical protein [Dehalococcoidales bacterium]